jgi:beta-glucanase (GH16 family)
MYISRRMLCAVAIALSCGAALEAAHSQSHPLPVSDPKGSWILQSTYSDEFNDEQLDSKKWNSDVDSWSVWSWDSQNVWLKDGVLNVRMSFQEHERKGKLLSYKSGIIKTTAPPILYGYFEARIKSAAIYPGVSPAFWAYRAEESTWSEIDFVELTEDRESPKHVDTNTHVFRHPKLQRGEEVHERRFWIAPWDPRDEFHIYGCEWTSEVIKWYVDGQLVNSRPNTYWHQALDVVLSLGVRSPLDRTPRNLGFPTSFQVDYVRVWRQEQHHTPPTK